MSDENVLGYIVCHECLEPKKIIQGMGKRARFLRAKCSCGASNLTGEAIQKKWRQHKTLNDVQAEIEQLKSPTPLKQEEIQAEDLEQTKHQVKTSEQDAEPSSIAKWVFGGLLAAFGVGFTKLARA